jgi:hypothetical protein
MRGLITIGAVIAATLLICTGSAAAHGYDRNCGSQHQSGAGWGDVKSFNTKCHEARKTARHYFHSWIGDRPDHRFNGWHCKDHRRDIELWKANCVRNRSRHQHIKFTFGF